MRTCIVTGANSGIGKCAASQLAKEKMRVILACRNVEQGEQVCAQIQRQNENCEVFARRVDLSLVSDTKRFCSEFTHEFAQLDVLINNAADFDLARKKPSFTSEGNETQFSTNLLAPFVLTQELLPLLRQSNDGRILNIATQGLVVQPNIRFDFDNIRGQKSYSPAKAYYQTKLGLLMLSLFMRAHGFGSSTLVYAIRVTNVTVDMARYPNISAIKKAMYKVKSRFSISPDEMAKVYTKLAVGPKLDGFYYDEKLLEVQCNKNAYDKTAQERLWLLCEELATAGIQAE